MRGLRMLVGVMVLLAACTSDALRYQPPVSCPGDRCTVVGVAFSEVLTLQELRERAAGVGATVVAVWRTDPICVPGVVGPPGQPGRTPDQQASHFAYANADVIRDIQNERAPPATDVGFSRALRDRMVVEWEAAQEPGVMFAGAALLVPSKEVVVPETSAWVLLDSYLTGTTRVLYLKRHADAFAPLTGGGILPTSSGRLCPGTLHPAVEDRVSAPDDYRTDEFSVPFFWRRSDSFVSSGESAEQVNLDVSGSAIRGRPDLRIDVYSGSSAEALAVLAGSENEWAELAFNFRRIFGDANGIFRMVWEADVGGYEAAAATVDVDCQRGSGRSAEPRCQISGRDGAFFLHHGSRVVVISLDVETTALPQPVTIMIQAPSDEFDEYWFRVAGPVLESIEFVDS